MIAETRPAKKSHVSHNSGNNEWYTPPQFIEAARATLGTIDCDHASSDFAQQTIQATTYYTAENDGLTQPWGKRVWMNPPYGKPLISEFCTALTRKYQSGEVQEACVLVNNATETAWFRALMDICTCACFLTRRIKFLNSTGKPQHTPLQGQVILYFGPHPENFTRSFSQFGKVMYS